MSIEELQAAVDEAMESDLFDLTPIDDEEDLPSDFELESLNYLNDPCFVHLEGQTFLDDYPF